MLVVLRNTDIDSKGLYEYLTKRNMSVISVVGLRQKFEHYRSFVVECNEMIADRLFDDLLWDAGILVEEYQGKPNPVNISSCFPPLG